MTAEVNDTATSEPKIEAPAWYVRPATVKSWDKADAANLDYYDDDQASLITQFEPHPSPIYHRIVYRSIFGSVAFRDTASNNGAGGEASREDAGMTVEKFKTLRSSLGQLDDDLYPWNPTGLAHTRSCAFRRLYTESWIAHTVIPHTPDYITSDQREVDKIEDKQSAARTLMMEEASAKELAGVLSGMTVTKRKKYDSDKKREDLMRGRKIEVAVKEVKRLEKAAERERIRQEKQRLKKGKDEGRKRKRNDKSGDRDAEMKAPRQLDGRTTKPRPNMATSSNVTQGTLPAINPSHVSSTVHPTTPLKNPQITTETFGSLPVTLSSITTLPSTGRLPVPSWSTRSARSASINLKSVTKDNPGFWGQYAQNSRPGDDSSPFQRVADTTEPIFVSTPSDKTDDRMDEDLDIDTPPARDPPLTQSLPTDKPPNTTDGTPDPDPTPNPMDILLQVLESAQPVLSSIRPAEESLGGVSRRGFVRMSSLRSKRAGLRSGTS